MLRPDKGHFGLAGARDGGGEVVHGDCRVRVEEDEKGEKSLAARGATKKAFVAKIKRDRPKYVYTERLPHIQVSQSPITHATAGELSGLVLLLSRSPVAAVG